MPVHTYFDRGEVIGLTKESMALAEQTCDIEKHQLIERIGYINNDQKKQIAKIMLNQFPIVALALDPEYLQSPIFQKLAN